METTKTTKEALAILGRYIGQTMYAEYVNCMLQKGSCEITGHVMQLVELGKIKSFRITSLRSLDEMTEEEKGMYQKLQDVFNYYCGEQHQEVGWLIDTAESIHYLESIGIDTMNLKDVTILIKD